MQKTHRHESIDSYFYPATQISMYFMRDDSLNPHIDPVRTEITGTEQIPISHICDSDERASKRIIVDENLSQVCSTNEGDPESVIVDENSMEDSKSKSVHKIINTNKEKYSIDETEHK